MKDLVILGIIALGVLPSSLSSQGIQVPQYKTVMVTANLTEDSAINVQDKREIRVSYTAGVDTFPTLVWDRKPDYPVTALNEKAEGLVETKLYVDKQGVVSRVEITQSSGRQDLDNAALEAAKQYKFKPARLNGTPVNTWVIVPFQFRMTSSLSTIGRRFEREELPPIIIKEDDRGGEETVAAPKERRKDEGPRFSKIVRPKYPDIAKMQHARAQVDVAVTVDEKGDVIAVSSHSQVRDDLVRVALAAAARCKFFPAFRKGAPVESSTFINFLFGRDKVMTDAEFLESLKVKLALPERAAEVNPEKAGVSIAFKNEVNSTDSLVIYDLTRKKIRSMFLGKLSAGAQEVVWDRRDDDGKDVESGIYFYIVIAMPDEGSTSMKYFGKVSVIR
jgi:TonB family protein